MAYFLRYTATPTEDLERGTSLHMCDGAQEGAEFIKGQGWAIILDGLCAHSVEGDNDEDAIEDATSTVIYGRKPSANGNYPEGDGFAAYLFKGEYCGDCGDGDLFKNGTMICNVSEIA